MRRGRRRDHDEVLAVDHAAFAPFWRLDHAGLEEALSATVTVHFQTARAGSPHRRLRGVRGGRAPGLRAAPGRRPRRPAPGRGAAPLADGLRWLRRWGAATPWSTPRRATSARCASTSGRGSCSSRTAWPCSASRSRGPDDGPPAAHLARAPAGGRRPSPSSPCSCRRAWCSASPRPRPAPGAAPGRAGGADHLGPPRRALSTCASR